MSDQTPKYDFPGGMEEEILCSYCNAYVSCGPIKVSPDGGTICGRCSSSSGDGSMRHILFETVMSKFIFPCRYKAQGCEQRLTFGAVEHEDVCPYRTFSCPSLPHGTCSKKVSVFDIYKHFEESHENLIVKDGKFKVDLQLDSQCNLLMNKEDVLVAIQYIYDAMKKILQLDVTYFSESSQAATYKLQIVSGLDSDRSVSFSKEHPCYSYTSHILNEERSRNFHMGDYLPALGNPSFVFISIILKNSGATGFTNQLQGCLMKENLSLVNQKQKSLDAGNSLETVLCYYCNDFAYPPVYKVDSQIMVCYKCTNNCRSRISQHTTQINNFPCRWRECSFVSNANNIRKHVEECPFRTLICPLSSSCQKGYYTPNTLMKHMQDHRAKYCPNPERIIVELFTSGTDSVCKKYFTKFNDELVAFMCKIEKKGDEHSWQLRVDYNDKFDVDIYFEHDHCSVKSKTISITTLSCNNSNFTRHYPECFKFCKCIWAVLKIKKIIRYCHGFH